jgi:hypothetical protein
MANKNIVLVFVHGWSVSNTDTYGGLPERLRAEAAAVGMDVVLKEIFLGRYVSFHDEVRLPDISRAFASAVEDQLASVLKNGTRFVCITHSTGGPVIRDWWYRYYQDLPGSGVCPMSHLIMLAPANYGSALAQLGKGRLSRMKLAGTGQCRVLGTEYCLDGQRRQPDRGQGCIPVCANRAEHRSGSI